MLSGSETQMVAEAKWSAEEETQTVITGKLKCRGGESHLGCDIKEEDIWSDSGESVFTRPSGTHVSMIYKYRLFCKETFVTKLTTEVV